MANILLWGCNPEVDKVAIQIMQPASPDEDINLVKEGDWVTYRAGIWSTIRSNSSLIMKLKAKLQRGPIDTAYLQYLNTLDDRNTVLETNMYTYDSDANEWAQNKLSFIKAIKELGADLNAIKVHRLKFQTSL
jgi:hypothetical protein